MKEYNSIDPFLFKFVSEPTRVLAITCNPDRTQEGILWSFSTCRDEVLCVVVYIYVSVLFPQTLHNLVIPYTSASHAILSVHFMQSYSNNIIVPVFSNVSFY